MVGMFSQTDDLRRQSALFQQAVDLWRASAKRDVSVVRIATIAG